MYAKNTAANESTTFKIILAPAKKNSEFLNKLTVSNENVEKVVNPPQNPVVNKILVCDVINLLLSK